LKGYRFDNAEQGLEANFGLRGLEVHRGRNYWLLRLQEYGRGTNLVTLKAANPTASKNRIEYERGAITEWYVNGPMGIEQGFTIASPPRPKDDLPLSIILALSGNVTATVDSDRRGVTLTRNFGQGAMQYTGLSARDANGRSLPAWLDTRGHQLLIQISDSRATYPIIVDPFVQAIKLVDSAGKAGYRFGNSVANDSADDTIVVGEPGADAAYIFERPKEGGWGALTKETSKLTVTGLASAGFGASVSIDNSTVVVGAPSASGLKSDGKGRAFVFVKPGKDWPPQVNTQNAILLPLDPDAAGLDRFGTSVSIIGGTVVVGAPRTQGTGVAYVFLRLAGWTGNVNASAVLKPNDGSGKQLGFSVAQSSSKGFSLVVAGQPSYSCAVGVNANNYGRALVFVKPNGGWNGPITERAVLTPKNFKNYPECSGGCGFGSDVDIIGGTVAVGAPYAGGGNPNGTGAAYVFLEPEGGWQNQSYAADAALKASDGKKGDTFGWSVRLSKDVSSLLVGAPLMGQAGSGKAYLFDMDTKNGWKGLKERQMFTINDGNDNFGAAVSTSNANENTLTIGAFKGTGGKNGKQPNTGAAVVYTPGKKRQQVNLEESVAPGTGTSGVNYLGLSASGFADGDINPANVVVNVAKDCKGDASAIASAASVVSGSDDSKLVSFLLPSGLAPGKYFVSIRDSAEGDANFESSNCSAVNVAQ